MAEQLRQGHSTLEVVHELKVVGDNCEAILPSCCMQIYRQNFQGQRAMVYLQGQYHMFVTHTPYIDPLMFHLAAQQNALTSAVPGAEKTKFAWYAQLLMLC